MGVRVGHTFPKEVSSAGLSLSEETSEPGRDLDSPGTNDLPPPYSELTVY